MSFEAVGTGIRRAEPPKRQEVAFKRHAEVAWLPPDARLAKPEALRKPHDGAIRPVASAVRIGCVSLAVLRPPHAAASIANAL